MLLEHVANRFRLGALVGTPVKVPGGLSNEMWRVRTVAGDFAVKRMVVNAEQPGFVDNVEAAFHVEHRAWVAGVAMPEPIAEPDDGRALARVEDALYRVHRWVAGQTVEGPAEQAAELLATIHAAGEPRWERVPTTGWNGSRWGADLAELGARFRDAPDRMLMVNSHRDLDPKNALLRADGTMLALDWDAAGPTGAAQEAVAVALDWAGTDTAAFAAATGAYQLRSGLAITAEPWVFGGWVSALGEWLDYNADHRSGEAVGRREVKATQARLRRLAANLDVFIHALRRT